MKVVEFVPFRLTEAADIYSIKIDGKEDTEFQEFMNDDKRVCREIELGQVMTQAAHSEIYRLLERYRKK
jgi:hypothetical protein